MNNLAKRWSRVLAFIAVATVLVYSVSYAVFYEIGMAPIEREAFAFDSLSSAHSAYQSQWLSCFDELNAKGVREKDTRLNMVFIELMQTKIKAQMDLVSHKPTD